MIQRDRQKDMKQWYQESSLNREAFQETLRWVHYSSYHPSWDPVWVMNDYRNGVPLSKAVAGTTQETLSFWKMIPKEKK